MKQMWGPGLRIQGLEFNGSQDYNKEEAKEWNRGLLTALINRKHLASLFRFRDSNNRIASQTQG